MKYILVNIPCYVLVFLLSALKPLQLHIPVTGPFEQQRLNHRAICRTKSPRMETGRAAFLPQELLLTRTTHQMQATTDRSLAPDWFLCEMASKCLGITSLGAVSLPEELPTGVTIIYIYPYETQATVGTVGFRPVLLSGG